MKIYITNINESWIIDRVKKEWVQLNKKVSTKFKYNSDIVWVIAPWSLKNNEVLKYKNKKIIYSVYHIEESSKNSTELNNIFKFDYLIDAYHTISMQTYTILKKNTKKPIYFIPFWVNQKIFFNIKNKKIIRDKYGFSENEFLVGSFQRDTESKDLTSPKLIKGPDILVALLSELNKENENLIAVLTGKRRNYVINELEKLDIKYKYFEMTEFNELNELYNILNLYLITSRLEGGPQALVECGQTLTPVLSTNVGIAELILAKESIYDFNDLSTFKNAKTNVEHAFLQSSNFTIPNGMTKFIQMFKEVHEK